MGDVEMFNTQTGKWEKLPPIPEYEPTYIGGNTTNKLGCLGGCLVAAIHVTLLILGVYTAVALIHSAIFGGI